MKPRSYYETLFEKYPDVVTLGDFRALLGGVGDCTARKIVRANHVYHFYIRQACRGKGIGQQICQTS